MLEKFTTFTASCDACGVEELDTEETDFRDAVSAVKMAGWKIQRDKHGNWEHLCPDCRSMDCTDDFGED